MVTANQKIKVVSTLALGLQIAQPAMGHNGKLHGQQDEATPVEPAPHTAGPEPIDSNAYVADDKPAAAVESASEVDGVGPLSAAASFDSLPIGFGEILFGVVLIFPWLLITLRKQLHLSSRS